MSNTRKFRNVGVGVISALILASSIAISPPALAGPTPAENSTTLSAVGDSNPEWVGVWGAAPARGVSLNCSDCTIRNTARLSLGGTAVRVVLSNAYGSEPLTVAHTTVSTPTASGSASAISGSVQDVTFSGETTVTIPVGGQVRSDAITRNVASGTDIQVSTFTPGSVPLTTQHPAANHTTYRTSGGDKTAELSGGGLSTTDTAAYTLTGVEVSGSGAAGALVAIGDSITDGSGSTVNLNDRWTDLLAGRLSLGGPAKRLSVVNAGLGSNRVILDASNSNDPDGPSMLNRFTRDVLSQPGVTSVLIFGGINDLNRQSPRDPAPIIAGLSELADRAHAAGLRVIGGTITPWNGTNNYGPSGEAARQTVNNWIRTTTKYDAVADFDAALRNPADTTRILANYDSGDRLHPNPAGYAAMANAINVATLSANPSPGSITLSAPATASRGQHYTVSAQVTATSASANTQATLNVAPGWVITTPRTANLGQLDAGETATAIWGVTVTHKSTDTVTMAATAVIDGSVVSTSATAAVAYASLSGPTYLSDMAFTNASVGFGTLHRDDNLNNEPIKINGVTYAKGVVAHAKASISVALNNKCTLFTAAAGLDYGVSGNAAGTVAFEVIADGVSKATFGSSAAPIRASSPAVPVSVDVTGVSNLELKIGDAGDGINNDHGAWADAKFQCSGPKSTIPVVSITTAPSVAPASGWFTTPVTATITAQDADNNVAIQSKLGTGAWTAYTAPLTLTDGTNTLSARATDTSQNTSEVATSTVKIDTVAPTTTATFNDTNRTVSLSATDATSGVSTTQYKLGTGDWTTYTTPVATGDAATTVAYRSTDKATNTETTKTLTVPVKPDTTAPVVSITTAPSVTPASGWFTTPVTATITAQDNDTNLTVQSKLGTGAWTAYTAPLTLTDGTNTLSARATDTAGNVSTTVTSTVKIDTVAPTTTAFFDETNRTVTLGATDITSGVSTTEYRLGSGDWTTYTTPVATGDAATTVAYRSTDNATNTEGDSVLTVPAKPDTTVTRLGTSVTSKANPGKAQFGKSVQLTVQVRDTAGNAPTGRVTISDGATVIQSGNVINGAVVLTLPKNLSVGTHPLVVSYLGTTEWLSSSSQVVVKVTKATSKAKITVKPAKVKSTKRAIVKVSVKTNTKVKATGQVTVKVVRGKKTLWTKKVRVNSRGTASVKLPKLTRGKYSVQSAYSGSTVTSATKVTKKVTVRGK